MTDNNNTVNINSTHQQNQDSVAQSRWYNSDDKFLHFFECKERAKSFICLELSTGVRILTIIGIFIVLGQIIYVNSILAFIMQSFALYADLSLLYSTWSKDYNHALVGYVIAIFFFWLEIFIIFFISVLIVFFFGSLKVLMIFLLIVSLLYSIKVYFLWIVFSYLHTLKRPNEQVNSEVVQHS